MKILPILNYNFYTIPAIKKQNATPKTNTTGKWETVPLSNYPLNFGCNYTNFQTKLLSLDGVHCPCCGEEMLSAQKAAEITSAAAKAQTLRQYNKVLNDNIEYFHSKYHPFIKSLNRLTESFPDKSIEDAIKMLHAGSSRLILSTMHKQAEYLYSLAENPKFSKSDREKLELCANYLSTRENLPKRDAYDEILNSTLRQLDTAQKKDIVFDVNKKIMSAYNCRGALSSSTDKTKEPDQEYIVKTMLSYSQNSLVKIYETKPDHLRFNNMLLCKECKTRYKNFKYLKNLPNIGEHLKLYTNDIEKAIVNNRLGEDDRYLYDFIGTVNSFKSPNIKIGRNFVNGTVQSRIFSERKRGYMFEQYRGVPCGTCGTTTITHDEKLNLFNDINHCENIHELYNIANVNKNHIVPKYRKIFDRFEKLLKENQDISETEILNQLQIANRNDLNEYLNNVCEKLESEFNKNNFTFVEKGIIKDFIINVKENFTTIPPEQEICYDDYNNLIEKTLGRLHHTDRVKLINIAKGDFKRYYMQDYIVHPPENIIQSTGSELKAMFQNIFKMSVLTVDHMDALAKGGADEYYNKVGFCKDCNNEKGRQPFKYWVKQHPEINKNLPKHLKFISEIIKKETLKEMINYPAQAAKQANKLGQGYIHIQTDYGLKD